MGRRDPRIQRRAEELGIHLDTITHVDPQFTRMAHLHTDPWFANYPQFGDGRMILAIADDWVQSPGHFNDGFGFHPETSGGFFVRRVTGREVGEMRYAFDTGDQRSPKVAFTSDHLQVTAIRSFCRRIVGAMRSKGIDLAEKRDPVGDYWDSLGERLLMDEFVENLEALID